MDHRYQQQKDQFGQSARQQQDQSVSETLDDDNYSVLTMGKRKFFSAVKSTKESSYFKSISTAIQSSFTYEESPNVIQPLKVPDDAQILLYKTYSRFINDEYITDVSGCIYCPGVMNRKNKLLLSLLQRLSKTNVSATTVNQIEAELEDSLVNAEMKGPESDSASTMSSSSSSSSMNSTDTIKDRMQGIIARNIARSPLKITVGSDIQTDSLLGASLYSDAMGSFHISIATQYPPSYVAVSSQENKSIIQTQEVNVILPYGVSVITDIDDTIRITGVLGDKRELFRNVFGKEFAECEVPRLSKWIQILNQEYDCPIHYVSNSPWQIYNIILGFMNCVGLPADSIHLRQYSGNLIASFTQPSAERKKGSLIKILKDFPNRKFILIGDSGEQDLEAYMSVAALYPDQVLAVYIRALTGAFSSVNDDLKSFKELQAILAKREVIYKHKNEHRSLNPEDVILKPQRQQETEQNTSPTLTDLSVDSKLSSDSQMTATSAADNGRRKTPLPPPKPKSLKGNTVTQGVIPENHEGNSTAELHSARYEESEPASAPLSSTVSFNSDGTPSPSPNIQVPPPPPPRRPHQVALDTATSTPTPVTVPPPLPKRRTTSEMFFKNQQLRNSSAPSILRSVISPQTAPGGNLDENGDVTYDKKRDSWKDRIYNVAEELNPNIEFKFWWDVGDIMDHSFVLINKEKGMSGVPEDKNHTTQIKAQKNGSSPTKQKSDDNLIDL